MHSLQELLIVTLSSLFRFIRSSVGHVRSLRDLGARPLPSFANYEKPCPSYFFLQIHMSSDCQPISFAYLAIPTIQSFTVRLSCTFWPAPRQLNQRLIAWKMPHFQLLSPSELAES